MVQANKAWVTSFRLLDLLNNITPLIHWCYGNQQWQKKIRVIKDYLNSLSPKVDVLCLQEDKLRGANVDRT